MRYQCFKLPEIGIIIYPVINKKTCQNQDHRFEQVRKYFLGRRCQQVNFLCNVTKNQLAVGGLQLAVCKF